MKLHVAILKTVEKFQDMVTNEKYENFDKAIAFLEKYKDQFDDVTYEPCQYRHQVVIHYYKLTYINKKGEAKQLVVSGFKDDQFKNANLGITWL